MICFPDLSYLQQIYLRLNHNVNHVSELQMLSSKNFRLVSISYLNIKCVFEHLDLFFLTYWSLSMHWMRGSKSQLPFTSRRQYSMQAKKHWLWDQTGLGTSPDPATSHLYDLKQGHFKSDKIELYHSGEIAHAKIFIIAFTPRTM